MTKKVTKKKKPKTYLNKRGYAVIKSEFGFRDIHSCKKDMTVAPYIHGDFGVKPSPFPIFLESAKKLYLPKHYALEKFGEPEENRMPEGREIDLEFNGELRDYQKPIVKAFMDTCKPGGTLSSQSYGGIISVPCGRGKCLGINTPILMFDGTIKMVQDIVVGDKLMGDDSKERTVLSLARGREQMYKVVPTKGDPYIVNESHILSLKCSTQKSRYPKGTKVDMSVTDYLALPKSYHGSAGPLLGYRVDVNFPEKVVDMEPYALGYWLGDGNSDSSLITTIEKPVVDYFKEYANKLDCNLIQGKDSITTKHSLHYRISGKLIKNKRQPNIFLKKLQKLNLICNKHIPQDYKCNSRRVRLELLAGIIDSDGSLSCNGYDIIQKRERLLDDIIYLARSLGFAAYKSVCKKTCIYKGERKTGTYYRTCIHGKGLEEIPVKCPRKRASPRKQIKDALSTRIRLEKLDVDDYYGFEIDGNRRFLLGDFTVTHNTIISLNILSQLKRKTLIIVHKEFLIEQWVERITQFLPHARIGLIRQKKVDVLNKDIVIGMLQSISMKSYPEEVFEDFGFCIVDEAHHISCEVFSRSLPKIGCKYMCGLSATPKRADGLSKVFEYYLGPIVYKEERKGGDNVRVDMIRINSSLDPYSKEEYTAYGKLCMSRMINNICEYTKRTDMIIELVAKMVLEERNILILSDRRGHLDELYNKIKGRECGTVGFYVGGMKPAERKASEDCNVILGTYSMASEGMDIPSLDSIIFASPKSNIVQAIGRILRKKHIDRPAQVYDIVDDFSSFSKQAIKRRRFYKRCKYLIVESDVYDDDLKSGMDLYEESQQDHVTFYDPEAKSPKSKKTRKNKKTKKSEKSGENGCENPLSTMCPF